MDKIKIRSRKAFTVIELIIIIAVIAILATIVSLGYQSIIENATKVSLVSDLVNASDQIKIYQADNGHLPTSIGCPSIEASNRLCVNVSKGNEFIEYHADNTATPKTFQLSAKNGDDYHYRIASGSNEPLPCPVGFVIVPGSKTYGTEDFCVMKYEAKKSAGNVPVSAAAGLPWTGINQYDAIDSSKKVENCETCHLIKESEWMTIVQNLLKVKTNWNGGDVGVNYIYNGHNDSAPDNFLEASNDDTLGYFGTGNSAGDMTENPDTKIIGDHEKRTLTLSNGEVLWDIAGNVSEWTDAQSTSGQPGIDGFGLDWREFKDLTNMHAFAVNIYPSGLGITGADTWTRYNGIGMIYSNTEASAVGGFARGGDFNDGGLDGVMSIRFNKIPDWTFADVGFRVSR